MTQNFSETGIFLIQTAAGIYLYLLLLRFLMQVARADYYNPICQTIVKLTTPAVKPFKMFLPRIGRVDLAILAAALGVQIIAIVLVIWLIDSYVFQPIYIAWAALSLAAKIIDIYFFALIVTVIASWIAPQSNHPVLALVHQIIEPICAPARRLLPPMGGLDFSIILVFVTLIVINNYLVIQPIAKMLNAPRVLLGL